MQFAFAGDDFFFGTYLMLNKLGCKLVGAWIPERDNIYSTNERVTQFCENLDVPVLGRKVRSQELAKLIEQGLDFLVVGSYPHKVPTDALPRYHINMHPSLLPHGRGPCPIPCSILRGEKRTGLSFHKITDQWDRGDIVLQKELGISPDETHDSLSVKQILASLQLMKLLVSDIDRYWNNAMPQEKGDYWEKHEIADRRVNWDMTAKEIDLKIRAFGRFGVIANINGNDLEITNATCLESDHDLGSGVMISGHKRDIAITCSDGFVCVSR